VSGNEQVRSGSCETGCGINGPQWLSGLLLFLLGPCGFPQYGVLIVGPAKGGRVVPADEARYTATSGWLVFSAALLEMLLIGSGKL
jgi:hypothetical protein